VAGLVKALAQQFGPDTLPLHAGGKVGAVIAPPMQVLHAGHHTFGALRVMLCQPLPEDRGQFPGQAQHLVEGTGGTCLRC